MSDKDDDALKRAIEIALAGDDRGLAELVNAYLKEGDREGAGETAAYGLQYRALQLMPWQNPPCCLDEHQAADIIADPTSHDRPGALTLKKLRRRGLSIYEPDLLRALA